MSMINLFCYKYYEAMKKRLELLGEKFWKNFLTEYHHGCRYLMLWHREGVTLECREGGLEYQKLK
jgi:hypothetical protein